MSTFEKEPRYRWLRWRKVHLVLRRLLMLMMRMRMRMMWLVRVVWPFFPSQLELYECSKLTDAPQISESSSNFLADPKKNPPGFRIPSGPKINMAKNGKPHHFFIGNTSSNNWWIFHCHASFPGGTIYSIYQKLNKINTGLHTDQQTNKPQKTGPGTWFHRVCHNHLKQP